VKPFDYIAAADLPTAVRELRDRGTDAHVIAGGQSLLLAMKQRQATPACLVSIAGIPELRGVRPRDDGALDIGAATTYAHLERADLPDWLHEIAAVAGNLADRPVRTMGTVGGAICQADPRFDMPTLALGLDARLELVSADGVRQVSADDFFSGDKSVRRPTEILTRITVPAASRFTGVAFEKFRFRRFDTAIASVACAVRIDAAGSLEEVRFAIGAVGPRPALAQKTAESLNSTEVSGVDAVAAGSAVAAEAVALSDGETEMRRYQHELVAALARDAFRRATILSGE
jgi:carbon-monoxide dehydrogenase medium subunit